MNVLQAELDEVRISWNTHLIRHARSPRQVTGIPDELFYIPEIQGKCISNLKLHIDPHSPGYQDYTCDVDEGDLAFCHQYAKNKPLPVCQEFMDLANILMSENQWDMPQNCEDALILYFNLVDSIENA